MKSIDYYFSTHGTSRFSLDFSSFVVVVTAGGCLVNIAGTVGFFVVDFFDIFLVDNHKIWNKIKTRSRKKLSIKTKTRINNNRNNKNI